MTHSHPKGPHEEWRVRWDQLGLPVWGVAPDGKISFMNEMAESLLGLSAEECIGHPCHEIINEMAEGLPGQKAVKSKRHRSGVGGCDPCRGSACVSCYPQIAAGHDGRPIESKPVKISRPDGSTRWIQIMPMLMSAPDGSGPHVIVSAVDIDRWARIAEYVMKIAKRQLPREQVSGQGLTPRENEILGLLAEDLGQHEIAEKLCISYSTVRTHVQRIIAKLGVHSIQAAIARHLVRQTG